jgi:peptide/nickel transport system permease protein
MLAFIIRRILYAIPILLGVSLFVFVLIRLVPGDVVDILIPPEAPRAVADALRERFGLDRPIHIQYLSWLQRVLVGDFGISAFNNRPVAPDLFQALGNSP